MENPTYPMAYRLIKSLGANIHAAEVDKEGHDPNTKACQQPKFVYTRPSCPYTTGIKMCMLRGLELLKWTVQKEALIVEDGYNHEFSNWKKPL